MQELLKSGRYLAAMRQAGTAARDPQTAVETRVQAALIASAAAYALELYAEAREFALIAQSQATDKELQAKVLHYLGAALAYYDPVEAEGILLAALAHGDTAHVQQHRGSILGHLAVTYERRRDDMAVKVYQQAAESFLEEGRQQKAVAMLQNAAWLVLLAGRAEAGKEILSRTAQFSQAFDAALTAHQQALESYALLVGGSHHEAISLAEEVLQPGRHATPWSLTLAAIVAAEAALVEGMRDFAAGMVTWAQGHVSAARCTKLANLLGDLRRRVESM